MLEEDKSTVRAVDRALDILLVFTEEKELGLSEIAKRISLHKSTVHRLIGSLESKGFVMRNPETEKYKLGYRILELSSNLTQSDDISILLLPEMEKLRDLVGETISLYVRDGTERIRIQAVQSNQPIRRVAPIGARMPLTVGASSKLLVAFEDEDTRNQILRNTSWPEKVEREQFLAQLERIRKQGYATSVEERELGAAAVSAPIFNRKGKVIAALSISGPSNRLTQEKMQEIAAPLVDAATRMAKMVK